MIWKLALVRAVCAELIRRGLRYAADVGRVAWAVFLTVGMLFYSWVVWGFLWELIKRMIS